MVPDLERRARKYIFDYFYENARAPVLEEIMKNFRLDREQGHKLLKDLEAAHHIAILPGTQRILMANPFSGITTPFVDKIRGRSYFANCAWDTVSMHVMADQDTSVESYCHHCAAPIRISLSRGKMVKAQPGNPLIFLSVPIAHWYDNLINTCSNNMVYFASEEHQKEWLDHHPSLHGETLTVDMMGQVCQPLSRGRLDLGFTRPSPDKLMAYWSSLGLHGDYWKI